MKRATLISFGILFLVVSLKATAQSKIAAKFDTIKLQFKGTKVEQGKYLLRYVNKYAHIGDTLTVLPSFIDSILNDKVKTIRKKRMKQYLEREIFCPLKLEGLWILLFVL